MCELKWCGSALAVHLLLSSKASTWAGTRSRPPSWRLVLVAPPFFPLKPLLCVGRGKEKGGRSISIAVLFKMVSRQCLFLPVKTWRRLGAGLCFALDSAGMASEENKFSRCFHRALLRATFLLTSCRESRFAYRACLQPSAG